MQNPRKCITSDRCKRVYCLGCVAQLPEGRCLGRDRSHAEKPAKFSEFDQKQTELLESLKFKCVCTEDATKRWRYREMITHTQNQCDFSVIECPKSCGVPGFYQWNLINHLQVCKKRLITCGQCFCTFHAEFKGIHVCCKRRPSSDDDILYVDPIVFKNE